jgi:AmiR/NasT family two-component response regulator
LPGQQRILVFGPPFLQSLGRDIVADAADVEIVGELEADPAALDRASDTKADFVIVAVRDPELADVHLRLLEQRPRAKVLAVAGGEDEPSLWYLRPHREMLGETSSETLLGAIRRPDWMSIHAG